MLFFVVASDRCCLLLLQMHWSIGLYAFGVVACCCLLLLVVAVAVAVAVVVVVVVVVLFPWFLLKGGWLREEAALK